MKRLALSQDPERLARTLWALALLAIPVTSFRYFPFLGETTYVRPLAFYPLVLLLPLLLLLTWKRLLPAPWPGTLILLGVLALAVLAATLLGALFAPLPLRGQVYSGRVLRAWATLVIGLAFFVAAVWMNRDERSLRFTLRWLLAGFCLDLLWGGLQAVTFYTPLLEKQVVTHWQSVFSMRELVRTNRLSGLAYEPAWLASQLAAIYLPWLFASLLTGFRLTRFRWLEPALMGLGLLLLLGTYSRGGILVTAAAAGLTLLLAGRSALRSAWAWFAGGFRSRLWDAALRLAVVAVTLAALAGVVYFLGQKNYFRRLWETSAGSLGEYIIDVNAGARLAYSTAAMSAYDKNPWTGVGLGASGFYIYQNLPDWSLTTVPEIARQLDPQNRLYPNPKNLYVRLLAETGLLGFFVFVAFQFSVLGDALQALRRPQAWARFAGAAGLFAWLAIAAQNLTQDSLATPNLWLVPGILAGLSSAWPSNPIDEDLS